MMRRRRNVVTIRILLCHPGALRPDLVIADFNPPNGPNGLQVASKLREMFAHQIEVIILTGDISSGAAQEFSGARPHGHTRAQFSFFSVRNLVLALLRLFRASVNTLISASISLSV